MTSTVIKHSIILAGHKTSVSLEDAFWKGLKEITRAKRVTLSQFVTEIDKSRSGNLSSAIRIVVYEHALEQRAAPVLQAAE